MKKGGTMHFKKKLLIGLLSLLFVVSILTIQQAAFANDSKALVNTDWLAQHLNEKDMIPVYVGFMAEKPGDDKAKFDARHIPGSVYLDMKDLMSVMRGNKNAPDKARFEALMNQLGIRNNTRVVLYGGNSGNPFVPGAYYVMKYFGHDSVAILDGPFDKWLKEKRKTESAAANVYKAKDGDSSIIADADYVEDKLNNKEAVILDTRGDDEFTGEKKVNYIKASGHIPGAVHMNFYPSNHGDAGLYRSAEELQKEYENKGVTKDKEIIVYCEAGPRATDTFFVLKEILGYPKVKTYVGGWLEWGNNGKYRVDKGR